MTRVPAFSPMISALCFHLALLVAATSALRQFPQPEILEAMGGLLDGAEHVVRKAGVEERKRESGSVEAVCEK